ncbi:hypothetical protein GHV23_17970 [Proteus mirabilis]|nr:hypothetical protein [Proteus mirabilis]
MAETSSLAKRLKEQKQRDSETMESLMRQQLADMRRELTSTLQSELSTIKADIQGQSKSIGWSAFKSRIFWPTLTGLSLCIGILGGSWGVTQYLSNRAMVLSEQVRQGKTALEQLPKGWTFAKDTEAEYIVLGKKKPTIDVYQSKGDDWVIRVK